MKENIKEYGIITIGVLLVAIAIEYFFAPNDIAAGGVSGLAVVITHYVPSLSVGSLTFIMNLFLFILAFIIVGGDFGFKTIYASFGLSFVLWFMDRFMYPEALTTDLMLATIFGTIITAIGLAIVFNINASTGGTDILAKILNKYTTFNMGIALLCVDFLVTLLGAITFGADKGFYALLSVLINGPLIDKIIAFMNQKKQIVKNLRSRTQRMDHEGDYWTDAERENLKRMFLEGYGITEMAIYFQRTEPAISQQLEKQDLYERKKYAKRKKSPTVCTCSCKECKVDAKECPRHIPILER